jgi:hypothetical protein
VRAIGWETAMRRGLVTQATTLGLLQTLDHTNEDVSCIRRISFLLAASPGTGWRLITSRCVLQHKQLLLPVSVDTGIHATLSHQATTCVPEYQACPV